MIEKVVDFAEHHTPIALIGVGGIGKTSIALAVLHDNRIKQRFGGDRRFIRCDQFPASCNHFLSRLSKVIGAGVENPSDLAPLRPFLSSKEMLIVLDNAESILDPQGTDSQEIYALVEELCQLETISLCVTSRISTIPPDCETLNIPTLSREAAYDTFHHIYKSNKQSNLVSKILEELEFHPLSITLLATVAHHNHWDTNRLTREWERQRTGLLCTQHNRSLAATIELSLASPMFQELGPDAQGLLSIVAFFPQGVDENILDQLFPTISNRNNILDKFCILSLAYRSNGFVTMLAPLRDYLSPKDPGSSPLLSTIKEFYFSRLSAQVYPDKPGFREAQWIISEDVNVEHLLDTFTSIDMDSVETWNACANFMWHLYHHKSQLTILGPKIEGLPDSYQSKPECLFQLSQLFDSVGNTTKCKQLLIHTLKLQKEHKDELAVADTLRSLSDTNRLLGQLKEGIQQVEEALIIYVRLGDIFGQALSLRRLARLLFKDNQLDNAAEAASQAIDLLSSKGNQYEICQCYRVLGNIWNSKGETETAISHFGAALRIASSFNWQFQQFWALLSLADLFFNQGRLDDAHAHIEHAKSFVINDAYLLGHVMQLQATFWYYQCKLEEAKSEVLYAIGVFEKLGAMGDMEDCRDLLQEIEAKIVSFSK